MEEVSTSASVSGESVRFPSMEVLAVSTSRAIQRPMRADARRNHDLLVSTARNVFAELGVDAPLDEVSKRAGVGAGTLYRHFPTRQNLIEAVYRTDVEDLTAKAHEFAKDRPGRPALEDWIREHVRYCVNHSGLAATLKAALDSESEVFAESKEGMRNAAAAVLASAQDTGDVRGDVQPRDILLLGHAMSKAVESASDDEAERLFSVMLQGLQPDGHKD